MFVANERQLFYRKEADRLNALNAYQSSFTIDANIPECISIRGKCPSNLTGLEIQLAGS